jgi:autotransporter-associated beta strand protein
LLWLTLAGLALSSSVASAQLLDPVPFWKTDFSTDPTLAGVDANGDGMPDWFIRGGQTFSAGGGNLGVLSTDQGRGVWHHATTDSAGAANDAVLDSAPASPIAAFGAVAGSQIIARSVAAGGNVNAAGHTQSGLLMLHNFDPDGAGHWAPYGMVLSAYSGGQQIQWFNAANGGDVSAVNGGYINALPANDYLRIDAIYNSTSHSVTWLVYDDSTNDSLLASRTFTISNSLQPQTADAKLSLLDNSYSIHGPGEFYVGYTERTNQTFVWNSLVNTSTWNNTSSGGWNTGNYPAPSTGEYPDSAGCTALMSQSLLAVPAGNILITTADARVGTLTFNNTNVSNSLGWAIGFPGSTNALTFDNRTIGAAARDAILNFGLPGGSTTQQNTIFAPVVLNSDLDINVLDGSTGTIAGAISSGVSGSGITLSGGGGTLVLSGANTYSGPTQIAAGATLRAGAIGVIPATSTLTVTGFLDLGGYAQSIAGLTGAGTVTNGGNETMLTIGGDGGSISFNGTIRNGNGLIDLMKTGSAMQTLTGPLVNTYTGPTVVSGGTLVLDYSSLNGSTPTNLINSNSALQIGGGSLSVIGKPGAGIATSQSVAGTTIGPGVSAIAVNINGGSGTTLNLGSLVRNVPGGTVDFTFGAGTITTTAANVNGILGGFATVAGSDWATNSNGSGTGVILNLPLYGSNYASVGSTTNFSPVGSGTFGGGTPNAVNSIRFNAHSPITTTVASGGLIITSGGILVTANVGANNTVLKGSTSSVLPLRTGNAFANDIIVIQNNPSGSLTLQDVQLGVNAGTTTGLTKSGAGTLRYTTTNTAIINQGTGPITINAGTLQLNIAAGAIGAGRITIGQPYSAATATAALQLLNPAKTNMIDAVNSPVTIYRTGTLSLGGGNATIQNNGGLALFGDATSRAQVTTGLGTLTARNLSFTGGGSIATSSGKLVIDDGGSGGNVAYVTANNGIGATISGKLGLDNALGGNTTFAIADDPNLASELSISAVIADQAGPNGLIKTGAGNLVLTAANTFSGGVTVGAGTLTVSAVSTPGYSQPLGAASSAVVVGDSSGGTLDYGGVFSGSAPALARAISAGGAGGATLLSTTAGQSIAVSGGINGNGSPVTFDGAGNAQLMLAPISGGGTSLTKNGAGTLTIDSSLVNSYTGGTVLNAGAINVSSAAGLGSANSPLNFNGGTLQFATPFDPTLGRTVTLSDGGATIDTQSNNVTFGSSFGNNGSGGITKIGTGTLILNPAAAETYAGTTTVNAGTLKLEFTNLSPATNLLNSNSQLVLGGGTVLVNGSPSASTNQTFSGLTLTTGVSNISVTSNGGNSTTLALGSIVAHAGGIVDFTLPASGSITTTTSNSSFLAAGAGGGPVVGGQSSILGGSAIVGGANWATSAATGGAAGNITALATYSGTWSSNADVSDPAGPSGNIAVNSLRFSGASAAAQTDSLVIATGGILLAPSVAGDTTLDQHSGSITTTQGQGADYAPDLNVIANQSSGTFHLNSTISGNQNLNVVRTAAGIGVVTLGGAAPNTYRGTTRVLAGSSGRVELDLQSSSLAIPGSLVIGGGNNPNAGAATVKLLSPAQQINGNLPLVINSDGRLDFNNQPVSNYQIGPLSMTGGSVVNSGNGTSAATILLNGDVTAISSAGAAATIDLGSNPNSGLSWNNAAGSGNRNFTVTSGGPSAASDLTVSAVIRDGTPSAALTKLGSGVLTLSAPSGNLYSGGTTVSAGTLVVSSANGSGTGSGLVNVQTGGTLGGNGTIAGALQTISSGIGPLTNGHLAPGAGGTASTLTINGGLVLADNSFLDFRLKNSTAAGNDQIVAGNAVVLGAAGTLNINAYNGSLTPGTYKLITIPGGSITNTANAASWSIGSNNDVPGHTYSFSTAVPGEFDLIVSGTTSLVWTGHASGTGQADNVWDSARMNWANGASPTAFSSGAAVAFGDTNPVAGGSAPDGIVTVQSGGVTPSSVVFNNAAVNYTISNTSGAIGISGSASLAKSGSGAVTLTGVNTYTGGTTITGGTLTATASGSIGNGPLIVSAAGGVNSTLNLANNQTVSSLSGTVAPTGSATVAIAAGASLTVNQSTNTKFAGTLANSGTLTKAGSGTLELSGAPTFADQSSLNVAGGALRFNVGTGPAMVGVGVTASIGAGATLELAGSLSALAAGTSRASISNDSQTPAGGLLVSGMHQQVGAIDGSGNTLVNAGADLAATAIRQNALIIGGTAVNSATVTIAASNADGDPLAGSESLVSPILSDTRQSLASETELPPSVSGLFPTSVSPSSDLDAGVSQSGRSGAPVPEPPAIALIATALLAAVSWLGRPCRGAKPRRCLHRDRRGCRGA